jgi:hypothetical protein
MGGRLMSIIAQSCEPFNQSISSLAQIMLPTNQPPNTLATLRMDPGDITAQSGGPALVHISRAPNSFHNPTNVFFTLYKLAYYYSTSTKYLLVWMGWDSRRAIDEGVTYRQVDSLEEV